LTIKINLCVYFLFHRQFYEINWLIIYIKINVGNEAKSGFRKLIWTKLKVKKRLAFIYLPKHYHKIMKSRANGLFMLEFYTFVWENFKIKIAS